MEILIATVVYESASSYQSRSFHFFHDRMIFRSYGRAIVVAKSMILFSSRYASPEHMA